MRMKMSDRIQYYKYKHNSQIKDILKFCLTNIYRDLYRYNIHIKTKNFRTKTKNKCDK